MTSEDSDETIARIGNWALAQRDQMIVELKQRIAALESKAAPLQTPLLLANLTMESVQVFLTRTVPHGWRDQFDALGRAVKGLEAELGEMQREPVGVRSRPPVDRDVARLRAIAERIHEQTVLAAVETRSPM